LFLHFLAGACFWVALLFWGLWCLQVASVKVVESLGVSLKGGVSYVANQLLELVLLVASHNECKLFWFLD
jgi:hypothetical protein